MPTRFPTGIVTLVFTDIQDSSVYWQEFGPPFKAVLDRHNQVLREALARRDGVEVKTEGDAFFIAFERASQAVQFAVEAQLALARVPWSTVLPGMPEVRVRMGMHTGEPLIDQHPGGEMDYFGPAVNRAARVGAAGHGGQIVVSDSTRGLAHGELAPRQGVHPQVSRLEAALPEETAPLLSGIGFLDQGLHRLKGVGEERLWQVTYPGLAAEFPPLRTLNPARHNLPMPPTEFVGRERELEEWRALLLKPGVRLLTLVGFGGMGKTRTALQLAELAAEEFPDGVWWIDLDEATNRDTMLARLAYHLRIPIESQQPIIDQVFAYCGERELLLVLDNTEQIPDAGRVVNELLRAATRLKCLVTTRVALSIQAERLVQMQPLPGEAAERLFAERAAARVATFEVTDANRGDVRELCRRLEGVPLAIELAASRIRGLTPRDILKRLDEPFRLLQQRAPDLHPRQQALRAAIDWSYELLGPETQELLAQLAVFSGGFSLADAEEVCEGLDVFEGVLDLVEHSLLRAEPDPHTQQERYEMLETVRAYAAEQLAKTPDGGSEIRRRHAVYFLACAEELMGSLNTPAEVRVLREFFGRKPAPGELSDEEEDESQVQERELRGDYRNVRSAVEWAITAGEAELCARLGVVLGVFLQRIGFFQEAVRRVEGALAAASRLPGLDPSVRARLHCERSGLHLDAFEWAEGTVQARIALEISSPLGDAREIATALNLLGLAANGTKEFAAARGRFQQALEHYITAGDAVGRANALNNLGLAEYFDQEHGSRDEQRRYLENALNLYRQSGDRRGAATALSNLGMLAQELTQLDEAARHYREALQLERLLQNEPGAGRALSNLGEVLALQGELSRAYRLLVSGETLFTRIGSPWKSYTADMLQELVARLPEPPPLEQDRVRLRELSLAEIVAWAESEG